MVLKDVDSHSTAKEWAPAGRASAARSGTQEYTEAFCKRLYVGTDSMAAPSTNRAAPSVGGTAAIVEGVQRAAEIDRTRGGQREVG